MVHRPCLGRAESTGRQMSGISRFAAPASVPAQHESDYTRMGAVADPLIPWPLLPCFTG